MYMKAVYMYICTVKVESLNCECPKDMSAMFNEASHLEHMQSFQM